MSASVEEDSVLFKASASVLFDAVLHQTQDQIYFKDRKSRFIRVSDAVPVKFGLNSPEELIGKTDFDFFSEEHAREAFEDEQRIMQNNEKLINKTEKETWPDGRVTWVTSTKVPINLGTGEPAGLMGITRDITAQVEAQRALEESREQLQQKNEILEMDFQNAGRVQQILIPGPLPDHPAVEIGVMSLSMGDVGGDVVTFPLVTGRQLSFLLGDVSGHGVSAGIFTILVKHVADYTMPSEFAHPDKALIILDEHLKDLIPFGFVTAAVGALDLSDRERPTLTLANAALPPVLWFRRADSTVEVVRVPSENVLGLGICQHIETLKLDLNDGDCLLLMTDGVIECRNPQGNELGTEGLLEVFKRLARKPIEEIVQGVRKHLARYCGGDFPQDDTTVLALRLKPSCGGQKEVKRKILKSVCFPSPIS